MYEIRYNRDTMHITGIAETTKASGDSLTYALSACPALSRTTFYVKTVCYLATENLAEALARAQGRKGYRLCIKCEQAAARQLTKCENAALRAVVEA